MLKSGIGRWVALCVALAPFMAGCSHDRRTTEQKIDEHMQAARAAIEEEVFRIHKVETAIEPRFQEHFINANAIPHATDTFPELAKVLTLPDVAFNTGGSDGSGRRRRRG